jgi:hypothetical protein
VLLGKTWRLPEAFTVPIPGLMLMLVVSPDTDQRNVADCPRSIVLGSTSKLEMAGFGGGGAGAFGSGAFGGAGGGGFLQPCAANNSVTASKVAATFR